MSDAPRPPPNASIADTLSGGRLSAPSALRNQDAITALLTEHAPATGNALEIASGTGQHIVAHAAAMPGLTWQPTDIEPERLISIDAWAREANLPNLRPAQHLDASAPGWPQTLPAQDLIVLVNLLHLIDTPSVRTTLSQAALALAPSGCLVLYGPFLRDGRTTSQGDANFHASLTASDPGIGYKNDADIAVWLDQAGLTLSLTQEMPANNLAFVAHKPA